MVTPLSRARRGIAGLLLATSVTLLPSAARSAPVLPRLDLRAASSHVEMPRMEGEPVFLDLGLFLTSFDAPFELRASRPDYVEPIRLWQVVDAESGRDETIELPPEFLDGWLGLDDFLTIEIRNPEGELLRTRRSTFCPNGYERQRIDDSGPQVPRYPDGCFGNPFTRGMVWGIERGWAAGVVGYGMRPVRLPDGDYNVTATIDPRYVEAFSIAPEDAGAALTMTIETFEGCRRCPRPHDEGEPTKYGSAQTVPTATDPDPSLRPDLIALPAWGIAVERSRRGVERLRFGATVWSGGASSLVVEGFRRSDQDVMDAYQYFYRDGEVVSRAPVGTMEYDTRDRHGHWHFLQFARYSLLDADRTEVLRSRKESFCLAPTDAIDLSLPGAELRPGLTGLHTACGGPRALWVRETLPLGWGDTYFQSIPGQSFRVSDLPNGTYYIAVEANPEGLLFERSGDNNIELREVILKGRPGSRYVEVPPWNGIDTEAPRDHGCDYRC